MKPSGDRLYGRESEEAGETVEQRPCVRFENWSEEFLALASLRGGPPEAQGNQWSAACKGRGEFAISQCLDTRSQPIYAWAG